MLNKTNPNLINFAQYMYTAIYVMLTFFQIQFFYELQLCLILIGTMPP